MNTSEPQDLISSLELFSGLNGGLLQDIASSWEQVLVPSGQLLFRQGDHSDSMYVVATGRLDVSVERNGSEPESLYEIGRGETAGEMGLLTGDCRSATVSSIRDSVLYRLTKDRFEELLERHPSFIRKLACQLIERLKQSNTRSLQQGSGVRTFAVVPAGELKPTQRFADNLAHALNEIGPTLRITRATVERVLGVSDLNDHRVTHWLNEEESTFAFLLYEADPTGSAWTWRCVRQADRLLAVADFEGSREVNEIEAALTRMVGDSPKSVSRSDLVLLHRQSGVRPSGTEQWLAGRSVHKHHHVCLDKPDDFRRLARMLTGRAVGLVLGGGGARGFAHIGAIRALEEAGIPIELIGGTSQGALIAAQYALGIGPGEMVEMNRKLFREFRPFKGDITIPIVSFLTGDRSNKGLQKVFGDTHILDLRIPFFCISNNLSRARINVHRSGAVWRAVRASMSLPGIMAPVVDQGNLIIDGGILNNLPVDIMRQACYGPVIAVDVSPQIDLIVGCEDRCSFGARDFIRSSLLRGKMRFSMPNIVEILMRTAFLSSVYHSEEMAKQADLYIHPPTEKFSLLEWGALDELVELGYEFTRQQTSTWQNAPTFRASTSA